MECRGESYLTEFGKLTQIINALPLHYSSIPFPHSGMLSI
jgi:hypothetical protein